MDRLDNAIGLAASDIKILTCAIEFKNTLLALIASAEKRIDIAALYLENDSVGQEVMASLVSKKKQCPDVKIRIFVDDHRARRGLIGQKKQAGNQAFYHYILTENQVDIGIYGIRVKSRELLGVMHLKGMVFDDTVLYTGASINNVYCQAETHFRLDRYFLFNSAALAQSLARFFTENFVEPNLLTEFTQLEQASKKQLKQLSNRTFKQLNKALYRSESTEGGDIWISPVVGCGRRHNELNKLSVDLINCAKHSITLITPYFNLPRPLENACHKALKRGVNIRLIIGDKRANDFYIPEQEDFRVIGLVPYLYEQLLRRIVQKWQTYLATEQLTIHAWYQEGNSFHAKGMIVDDTQHLITGSNLNPRAWRLDLENALLLLDTKKLLSRAVELEVSRILAHCTNVKSSADLAPVASYPNKVRKLLRRIKLTQTDHLLKRFL